MLEGTWIVERKTEKAILFAKETNRERKAWVPKKVLSQFYNVNSIDKCMTDIRIPEWFDVKYVKVGKTSSKFKKKKVTAPGDEEWTEERKRIRDEAIAVWAKDAGKDKKANKIK